MNGDYGKYIKSFHDFPKPGVIYRDFTPLLESPAAFRGAIRRVAEEASPMSPAKIAAIEAKGFLIGAPLALEMSLPLVLIRKPGLTPGKTDRCDFEKEYGEAAYEMRTGVVGAGDRVLIVYDVLAGPGASRAAAVLVESSGAEVCGFCYIVELGYLDGRAGLAGYPVFSLVRIER